MSEIEDKEEKTDFEYEDVQEKLNPDAESDTPVEGTEEAKETKEVKEEVNRDETDFDEIEDMNDDDWQLEKAPEKEIEGKESKSTEPGTEDGKTEPTIKEVPPEVEKVLSMLGDDAMLKIKGQDYKVSDLTPEEVTGYLQKGMRFNQGSEENARERETLAQARQVLQNDTAMVRNLMAQYEGRGQTTGAPGRGNTPDFLQETEYDTESERNLKRFSGELLGRLSNLENTTQSNQVNTAKDNLMKDIDTLRVDFPGASIDEVIAVKTHYPHIPLDKLVEKSHEHYTSKEHLDTILNASPGLRRELEESVIVKYKARQAKANAVPGKRSATSGTKKVSTQKPKHVKDFDDAEAFSMDYLAEIERMRE